MTISINSGDIITIVQIIIIIVLAIVCLYSCINVYRYQKLKKLCIKQYENHLIRIYSSGNVWPEFENEMIKMYGAGMWDTIKSKATALGQAIADGASKLTEKALGGMKELFNEFDNIRFVLNAYVNGKDEKFTNNIDEMLDSGIGDIDMDKAMFKSVLGCFASTGFGDFFKNISSLISSGGLPALQQFGTIMFQKLPKLLKPDKLKSFVKNNKDRLQKLLDDMINKELITNGETIKTVQTLSNMVKKKDWGGLVDMLKGKVFKFFENKDKKKEENEEDKK